MSKYTRTMVLLCLAAFLTNLINWGFWRCLISCIILYGVFYFHNKYKNDEMEENDTNYMRWSGSYYDDTTTIISDYLDRYHVVVVYYRNYNKTFVCRKDDDGSIWQTQINTIDPEQKYFVPEFPMDDLIIYRPRDKEKELAYNASCGGDGGAGGSVVYNDNNYHYAHTIYTYNDSLKNSIRADGAGIYHEYLSRDDLQSILERYQSDPITRETLIDIFNKMAEYNNLGNAHKEEK